MPALINKLKTTKDEYWKFIDRDWILVARAGKMFHLRQSNEFITQLS